MHLIKDIALIEPFLPADGNRPLEDLTIELVAKANTLAANLSSTVVSAVGNIVRSMNCYYSNLIEGHHTHPIDIERALQKEYSENSVQRNLQLEAAAHIEVQTLLDTNQLPPEIENPASMQLITWLHEQFCLRLPAELLQNSNPDTGEVVFVKPGALRQAEVRVGEHIPPVHEMLPAFLKAFEQRYNPAHLSKLSQVIAAAASHHRLLWIHPFVDGNGRVARLFSYHYLKTIGIGNPLWSVARGLARTVGEYKKTLAAADDWRRGDLDGRGNLSEAGLILFCRYFLRSCIDQIDFMAKLLQPLELLSRIEQFCEAEVAKKTLLRGSFFVLRELVISGSVSRQEVAAITGYQERQAREVVKKLMEFGLLASSTKREKLELCIPFKVVQSWFPRLYPEDL